MPLHKPRMPVIIPWTTPTKTKYAKGNEMKATTSYLEFKQVQLEVYSYVVLLSKRCEANSAISN